MVVAYLLLGGFNAVLYNITHYRVIQITSSTATPVIGDASVAIHSPEPLRHVTYGARGFPPVAQNLSSPASCGVCDPFACSGSMLCRAM